MNSMLIRRCLVLVSICFLSSCSSIRSSGIQRPKHDPKEFVERRQPRENKRISLKRLEMLRKAANNQSDQLSQGDKAVADSEDFSKKTLNISKNQ